MRTPVTLDPDTRLLVEQAMRERGLTFNEAVNAAIRAGLGKAEEQPAAYTTPRALGPAHVDVTKAPSVAGRLEEGVVPRRLGEGR
jgi:hypothetical protein